MKFSLLLIITISLNIFYLEKKVNGNKLSEKVYVEQKKIAKNKSIPSIFNKNRKDIKWVEDFDLVLNNDTIFILEAYDLNVESDILITYATLWDSRGKSKSYERVNRKKIKESMHSNFSNYIKYLINTWDIETIRKEENLYKQTSGFEVYATRIILSEKIKIDCISFNNFSNFKKEIEFE